MMNRMLSTAALTASCILSTPAQAEVAGNVWTDWIGNGIVVEVIQDWPGRNPMRYSGGLLGGKSASSASP